MFMDDYRPPHDLGHFEPVGEEGHGRQAAVGEKHREIAGMVPVGLVIRIPVGPGGGKWICLVADGAIAFFVDVKPVRTYGRPALPGGLVRGKTFHVEKNFHPARNVLKTNHTVDSRGQRSADQHGRGFLITRAIPVIPAVLSSRKKPPLLTTHGFRPFRIYSFRAFY
jgi:hypothetical protein